MKTIVIRGRSLEHMHVTQLDFVAKALARVLAGEEVDGRDLVPYGIEVEIGETASSEVREEDLKLFGSYFEVDGLRVAPSRVSFAFSREPVDGQAT